MTKLNVDRMRRNLRRRWRTLPISRRFSAEECEQNERAVQAWMRNMGEDPQPAPVMDWIGAVERANKDRRLERDVFYHPDDMSHTVTIREASR